jgi:tRNA U34 5-methylaminomethyl-2-thiouridine-forming methyltransferase MnmC
VTGQQAELEWRDGVPVSTRFADPYYSLENGLAETRHVFLYGNGLPELLRPGFHVAELGVGTGLNLLALVLLVRATGRGPVRYTGFEAFPMTPEDMRMALAAFPEVAADAEALVAAWVGGGPFRTAEIEARFILGDARDTLPHWEGRADAWFLDGFAPARNPELWARASGRGRAAHRPGGTAATYSAAGAVRRALAAAGFAVERRPGYGRKRHMTAARLP